MYMEINYRSRIADELAERYTQKRLGREMRILIAIGIAVAMISTASILTRLPVNQCLIP